MKSVSMRLEDIIKDSDRLFVGESIPVEYKTDDYLEEVAEPGIVAMPVSKEEVIALVQYANENDLIIIPQGAKTGLSGAQTPIYGGELLIDLHLMNRILDLDEETLTLTVEPGALLQDVQTFAKKSGFYYPPDPGSRNSTIGGNVSTNAGGMHAVKYGTTRDYIRALEVVLPSGEAVELGSLNIKTSSGYDLKDLFIGSEGTLGVITQIKLKLIPLPKYQVSVLLAFESIKEATDSVITILNNGIDPTALEVFQRSAIDYAERVTGEKLPSDKGTAYILTTLDADDEAVVDSKIKKLQTVLADQALEILPLDTVELSEKAWLLRRSIGVGIEKYSEFENLDEVVPINRIGELIPFTEQLGEKYGIGIVNFGHAGDGNIHTILIKGTLNEDSWNAQRKKLLKELYQGVNELGGLPSAEHGIGVKKKEYLEQTADPVTLDLMRKIKQAIDPNNRMNPGKVV